LPHLVASILAGVTAPEALPLAAGGWRDTTRIALGDPQLWQQIVSQNRRNVMQALDRFGKELNELRQALAREDRTQIEQVLAQGRLVRRQANSKRRDV
jgi:prephenate dehydrogenase